MFSNILKGNRFVVCGIFVKFAKVITLLIARI
jgi:hypothetical protein